MFADCGQEFQEMLSSSPADVLPRENMWCEGAGRAEATSCRGLADSLAPDRIGSLHPQDLLKR